MGKIQDAIRKVQRRRGTASSADSNAQSSTAEDPQSLSQSDDIDVRQHESEDERRWDYGGRKIEIDREKMIENGLLDPDYGRKHLAAEYRNIIKTILTNIACDDPSEIAQRNMLLISSAERSEGRTFICLNLAMSLAAKTGYTVVLIDSDISNPQLSRLIGRDTEKGLTNWVADPSLDVMQLISPTDITGLAVLPVGTNREEATGLLGGDHFRGSLESLSSDDANRIFIFDSSPMLSSTEATALAEYAGQILFVVRAGKTPEKSVLEALKNLDSSRPLNIVLNQVIE